ncbi:MAG: hypothetical protein RXO32_11820 [Thermoproteus sp.]
MVDCTKTAAYSPVYRYFAIINSTECKSCINAYPIPVKNTIAAVWRTC